MSSRSSKADRRRRSLCDFICHPAADPDVMWVQRGEARESLWQVWMAELRGANLLHESPSCLGYTGNTWDDDDLKLQVLDGREEEPEGNGAGGGGDPYMQGLRVPQGLEAYVLIYYRATLEKGCPEPKAVAHLARQQVRQFRVDRQRKADPVGYPVYKNLQSALEALEQEGELTSVNTPMEKGHWINGSSVVTVHGADEERRVRSDEIAREVREMNLSIQTLKRLKSNTKNGREAIRGIALEVLRRLGRSVLVKEMSRALKDEVASGLGLYPFLLEASTRPLYLEDETTTHEGAGSVEDLLEKRRTREQDPLQLALKYLGQAKLAIENGLYQRRRREFLLRVLEYWRSHLRGGTPENVELPGTSEAAKALGSNTSRVNDAYVTLRTLLADIACRSD